MIFHKVVKNEPTLYQTLWSCHNETWFFLVSASVQEEFDVNETMCFRADPMGGFKGSEEYGTIYPATRDHKVHEQMAADAFDELVKAKMGVDGGVQEEREERAALGLTAQHFVEGM
tara:strand:+ start:189 stop:536 length:348 start_codon:yes stop_codon:yes gene_type:complete